MWGPIILILQKITLGCLQQKDKMAKIYSMCGESINVCIMSVRTTEEKGTLQRSRHPWEDSINMNL
jgi:hypothetical protein